MRSWFLRSTRIVAISFASSVAIFGLVLVGPAGGRPAQANCAAPTTYTTTVAGNTVTVCPRNFDRRPCPDPGGLLREDPASATVVKLADHCKSDCYVDECVPAGDYRYGYAQPYTCCETCCGTDYYAEAKVTTPLPASCTRTAGNAAPAAVTTPVPWAGKMKTMCYYPAGNRDAGGPTPTPPDAMSTPGGGSGSGSGGCAVGGQNVSPVGVVLGANGLLVALGWAWSRRRRRRGRG